MKQLRYSARNGARNGVVADLPELTILLFQFNIVTFVYFQKRKILDHLYVLVLNEGENDNVDKKLSSYSCGSALQTLFWKATGFITVGI